VIDDEHVDYGSLRLHPKAEFFEYVEEGRAVVGITDIGLAALRASQLHRRPSFGLHVIEIGEAGLVQEWPVSKVIWVWLL